ncbi:hypothetical protein TNIN_76961 [Trichonephila inaurata madagascariensis]|uniref:Uncharacterized protein n=1 Tax=Trichonephila inaurata madagascariensis TaxID=2747483 RepID=A0A8X6WQH8_9ARAC|nr:hypothetical protein TNIN_76961 [Trichonephila inaurata madagascariensis]
MYIQSNFSTDVFGMDATGRRADHRSSVLCIPMSLPSIWGETFVSCVADEGALWYWASDDVVELKPDSPHTRNVRADLSRQIHCLPRFLGGISSRSNVGTVEADPFDRDILFPEFKNTR